MGKWIVFEGGEGVGKTTQIEMLYQGLKAKGISCIRTREPGGTPLAEEIRALFKHIPAHGDAPMPLTELLLISAARAQHIEKIIRPALSSETLILCDRFLDSTYVYQCLLGGLAKEQVDSVTKPILGNLRPDLTLVLTCTDNDAAARRLKDTQRSADRLDSYDQSIQSKINQGYQEILNKNFPYPNGETPLRINVSSSKGIAETFFAIKTHLNKHLGLQL